MAAKDPKRELSNLARCAPDATTRGADIQVFINWARDHPTLWSEYRLVGVVVALHQAWPCKVG